MLVDSCANIGRASVAWQESRPHIAGLYQGLMRPLAQPDLYTLDQHVCANLKPSTDTRTDGGETLLEVLLREGGVALPEISFL